MTHWLLAYDLAADYAARRGDLRSGHLALAWAAADAGTLVLGGAVGDDPRTALLLFTDRAAAEAFARADPYVHHGLVTQWRIDPWMTVVGDGAAAPLRPADAR